MTRRWGKLDCKIHENDKFRNLPAASAGIWMFLVAWSADNETDGFLPIDIIRDMVKKHDKMGKAIRHQERLVEAGLWDEVDGGYMIHDFADYQMTKVEKTEARVADATRQRRHRAGPGQVQGRSRAGAGQVQGKPEGLFPDESVVSHRDIVPKTKSKREIRETSSPAAPGTALVVPNAGTLVGEWIDSLAHRPTQEWIGQVSRKIRLYLEEGYPYDIVREAILAWAGTGKQPTQIDFHMNQILNPPTKPTWGAPRRASTTDGIFEDGLGVMARAAERDRYATQREITNEPEGTVRDPGHVSRAF